jgi:hypothetical protein
MERSLDGIPFRIIPVKIVESLKWDLYPGFCILKDLIQTDMEKKLGLLLIRGSGESGFKRQEHFIEKLDKELNERGININELEIELVDWYAPLQIQQESILERMKASGIKLKSRFTRHLIITNIGDLINYAGKPNRPSFAYQETHKMVHKSMLALKSRLAEQAPLVILASSMGTEIINNYIWDRQRWEIRHPGETDPFASSPFERFERLVGLFTFGSNLPIFSASHRIDSLEPITFPPPQLPAHLAEKAVWENYYDKNDSMGYPIKAINSRYEQSVVKDIQINTGGWLMSWNLLSHFGYWKSKKLVKRIANFIQDLDLQG